MPRPLTDERSIFLNAIEIEAAEERRAYLDAACQAAPTLRERVAALIRQHEKPQPILDLADLRPTVDQPPAPEPPGTRIGPYKLREQIGEGGFGVVYVAEQEKPVARKVALKIIKPGMDTREIIARFEAERQALALMDHPNIAKVLDAGTTSDVGDRRSEVGKTTSEHDPTSVLRPPTSGSGRPYFVMELVRGVPITEFCDERKLNTRERLALFIDVCRAVQHAHQKGIIHRDLKPSNVMVTLHDDKPVVKVIDFGVAKALSSRLTEKTVYTAYGQMVGTPLYMSPEQAQLSGLDVDTRSDVYSLGVLLYELLTGTTPFDKETLQKSGFDEMRRIIREVDPPRPSARISTLKADLLSTVSGRRQIDPRKLSEHLRGELDWIVMKALEKDRNRRYETAVAFAADVERYLADEPVQACPPSAAYRFRKFVRRRKLVLSTTATVAVALIAGSGVAWWQAVEATAAYASERTARGDADDQRVKADANYRRANANFLRAERERQQAQKNLQFAIDAVDEMYDRLAREWIADDVMATVTQRDFLRRALAFYRRLVDSPQEYAISRERAADLYTRISTIEGEMHNPDKELAARRKAVDLRRELFQEKPDDNERRMRLLHILLGLGATYSTQNRPADALRCYEECTRLAAAAKPTKLTRIRALRFWKALLNQNRAGVILDLEQNDKLDQAATLAREAQSEYKALDKEIGRFLIRSGNFTNYSRTLLIQSEIARRRGDFGSAKRIAQEALAACEFHLLDHGDRRDFRTAQEILNSQLTVIALARKDFPEAELRLRRQLEIIALRFAAKRDPFDFTADMLFTRDPQLNNKEQPELWHTWTTITLRLAQVLRKQGKLREPEILLAKARTTARYLSVRIPKVIKHRVAQANVDAEIALLLAERWPSEARYHLLQAAKTWHETLQAFPDADEHKSGFHENFPDLAWFRQNFPDYDFMNPELRDKVLKPKRPGRSVVHDRVMGLTNYRYQQWKGVAFSFQKIIDQRGGSDAFDRFYLAIGLARTGQYRQAREWYGKAITWIEQNADDQAELDTLKSEVKALLANLPVEAVKPRRPPMGARKP